MQVFLLFLVTALLLVASLRNVFKRTETELLHTFQIAEKVDNDIIKDEKTITVVEPVASTKNDTLTELCNQETSFGTNLQFLPAVPLASAPGSGNTWLRKLIEISTGYYTVESVI